MKSPIGRYVLDFDKKGSFTISALVTKRCLVNSVKTGKLNQSKECLVNGDLESKMLLQKEPEKVTGDPSPQHTQTLTKDPSHC